MIATVLAGTLKWSSLFPLLKVLKAWLYFDIVEKDGATTLSKMTLSIATFNITRLSIATFSIMTLRIRVRN